MYAKFWAKLGLKNKEKSRRHHPLHLRSLQFNNFFHLPNKEGVSQMCYEDKGLRESAWQNWKMIHM